MGHKNITLSIDEEVLKQFDAWRSGRPRGEGIAALLGFATSPITSSPPLPSAAGHTVKAVKLALGKATLQEASKYVGVPPVEVEGDDVRKQEPDEDTLRNRDEFYATKPEYVSTQPQNLKKVDPMDQSEPDYDYAQPSVADDLDQRAKRGKRG